jgi:hypothetical protein
MSFSGDSRPAEVAAGVGSSGSGPSWSETVEEPTRTTEKKAVEAATEAKQQAEAAARATEPRDAAAAAANAAAAAAESAAQAATAVTVLARGLRPGRRPGPKVRFFRDPWPFLVDGLHDFRANIKRTWPIVIAFVFYLLASASILFAVKVPSWTQALYDTWISMSTASELTTGSAIWVLAAANWLAGLLFFGFIVWLVTTSLYQGTDS